MFLRYPLFDRIKAIPFEVLFNFFSERAGCIVLDSATAALTADARNRYTYFASDPFATCMLQEGKLYYSGIVQERVVCPFTFVQEKIEHYRLATYAHLPPFQTGVLGAWSYDLCHSVEPVAKPRRTAGYFPEILLGFYDLVVAIEHATESLWIISSGFPFVTEKLRLQQARKKINWMKSLCLSLTITSYPKNKVFQKSEIVCDFTEKSYVNMVKKATEAIRSGDIFEVNVSQRFHTVLPKEFSKPACYLALRKQNPAPFAAYLAFGKYALLSASPERFLTVNDKIVETRPIKGTAPRSTDPLQDKKNQELLQKSSKDRAENIMIVDLMRNDLSKICEAHSVQVTQLCKVESFAAVHHLVSVVQGILQSEYSLLDLLKSCFPGGSITGAPKVRAMQIIAELEPVSRGPYCGSLSYIGFNGNMDSSILIRTYVVCGNLLSYHGGGAVLLDSDPFAEYKESCTKVSALEAVLCQTTAFET